MANLTTVGLTAGAGSSGTGTVSTLDNVIGAAGTANTNVQTVQGIASMVALKVDGSGVTQPVSVASLPSQAVTNAGTFAVQADSTLSQNATTSGQKAVLVQGAVTTAGPTYTTAQSSPLSLDTSGNLRVNVVTGGGSGGTSSTVGSAAPTTATAVGFSDGTNMQLGRIKAASTAPVATDPALVVAISPNSVNANGQATMANSAPVVIASNQSGVPVTGTFWQTTQPVSLATAPTTPVTGTFWQTTQPVSGTVTSTVADQYGTYNTVAASQTAQALHGGGSGASGDYLAYVTVFPGTAGCGVVTILDNATTVGTFAGGGTTALPSLVPFTIQIGAFSSSGAWKITTGANVTAAAVGKFT